MSKEYKTPGLSVEDRILEGICDSCDQDPSQCYLNGYCEYDNEETENVDKGKDGK